MTISLVPKIKRRLELSKAKHRSLAGHARIAKRIAGFLPYYEFNEEQFFSADGAPATISGQRREGFRRLASLLAQRHARSAELRAEVVQSLSDLQFTGAYRVPFPFRRQLQQHLQSTLFLQSSAGVELTDVDGNTLYDLGGSYGVNLFGYDFFKTCIEEGSRQVAALGPVLGHYHPLIVDNLRRLRQVSGLDEISFHMSGTEAVMQAVRLARYHTRRTHLVRFCGAYHGWWGDVQPGIGNPIPARETYTLKDLDADTLHVLRTREDIACVLVNPLQGLHPNSNAPGDSSLVDSSRQAHYDRTAYSEWLQQLRKVCTERNIVLIFDEVFLGFRLAPGGAQEYFGIQADMVTYGKALGGGLPVGVLCGRQQYMRRYREDHPADICFARGTFNSHPYVMATMNTFLRRIEEPPIKALYADLEQTWNTRRAALNERLRNAALPVRVANFSTVWTVLYTQASRYNWMFQYYLLAEGLALSWVGSGRFIFALSYDDTAFADVVERFVAAAQAMARDGWWWDTPGLTNKTIKRQILREMFVALTGRATNKS